MRSSETSLLVGKAEGEGRRALAEHLADALERLAADLRSGEYAPGKAEPVIELLTWLTRRAVEPGETKSPRSEEEAAASNAPEGSETSPLRDIVDPSVARTALNALQQLQTSLLEGALEHLDVAAEARARVETVHRELADGHRRLVDHWFGNASLREAELLAQVFHDLRSPLTSVLFLSDALYSGQSGSLSEGQQRQVQLIYTASLTLLTLVDNVLNSRNLMAGEVEPERVPFSLSALADEVERITRPLADQKGLDLEFRTDCRTARVGDPDALRRVMLNLVTNAISYTEEGNVTVRFREEEMDLVIQVEDSGQGMDDDELAHLFTPFRVGGKEGRSGERRFSGAGLGLSICHRLTRLIGGDIWVDTELGQGSRFGVQVPFPPVKDAPP